MKIAVLIAAGAIVSLLLASPKKGATPISDESSPLIGTWTSVLTMGRPGPTKITTITINESGVYHWIDIDVPFPFFFNGEELPRWSPHWHLCSIGDFLNNFTDDPESGWDEFVGFRHIWHLQCRIDHVGSIESEDPIIFHVCAQEVLRVMLLNRAKIIESIRSCDTDDVAADDVFLQIVEGLAKMLELCLRDSCAFWTSGYEEDCKRVLDRMRRSKLPRGHPEFVQCPHQQQRSSELVLRAGFQLSGLRALAQNGSLDKRLRRIVNQLPKLTE